MNKWACPSCGEVIESLGAPMKCKCGSTLQFNKIEKIEQTPKEDIITENKSTNIPIIEEDVTKTPIIEETPPETPPETLTVETIPKIVEESTIIAPIVNVEEPILTSKVDEENVNEFENPTEEIGFHAQPQIIRKVLNITTLPKGSTPFFQKIVLNKGSKNTTYYGVGMGGNLMSVVNIDNEIFNDTWGVGKFPIESKSAIDYVGMLAKHKKMSLDLNNKTNIIMFYSGNDDKIVRNCENSSAIDTSLSMCRIPLKSRILHDNLEDTPENRYLVPVLSSDEKFEYYFDVNSDEIETIITRGSKFDISQYAFEISSMGIFVGVGDMTNPEKGAFKMQIPVIKTSEIVPTLNITVSDVLSNIIANTSGIIRFNFSSNPNNPIWITGEIFEDNIKRGEYGFFLSVLIEG